MLVDRMQGLLHGASLPFFVSLFVFASVVCMFACVRACSFVRTFVDRQNDRERVGVRGGGVAKNHALVEAFYYRT
jgi:hypothetical protein